MDFDLSEDLRSLEREAREFAATELAPRVAEADATESFVAEQIRQAAARGYLGMTVPEAYGGRGLGALGTTVVLVEVNRACPSTGTTLSVHNSLACESLLRFGTEAQKRRYLPRLASGEWLGAYSLSEAESGSDAGALRCRAHPGSDGGFVLDGAKLWISHGDQSQYALVFARTDPAGGTRGVTAFAVETAWEGWRPGKKERKMGLRGSSTVELHLDRMKVPAENVLGEVNRGFQIALALLDTGRIGIAAQGVGIGLACLDACVAYVKDRERDGRRLASSGMIQERIAEMATRVEAARLLTYRAAWLKDRGRPHGREAAMAKLSASTTADFCAREAVQIHGAAGCTRAFPVERLFRDARVGEIYEGTTEIQRLVIARSYLRDG